MKSFLLILLLVLGLSASADGGSSLLLTRPVEAAGGGGSVTATYTDFGTNTTTSTTYTFSARQLGAESAGRRIFIGVAARRTSAFTVNDVTLDGVSATQVVTANAMDGANATRADWWQIADATGTTGDVVVTMSGSTLRCGIVVVSVAGYGSVLDSDNATGTSVTSLSTTVDTANNGAVIAFVATPVVGTGTTFSWSGGVSEVIDQGVGAGALSIGAAIGTVSAGTLTPQADFANTSAADGLVVVSIAP